MTGRDASPSAARAALAALAAALAGVACLQLIAPYDEQTERDTFAAARAVDQFYGELLEARPDARRYAKFSERYVEIESELRGLVLRNEVRPLNEDSARIATDILTLWRDTKARHQTRDAYQDGAARLDRDRFTRMFRYALTAERAKRGDEEDAPSGGTWEEPPP